MVTSEVSPGRRRVNERSPIENALRYIGGQRSGQLVTLLQNAIAAPDGEAGAALIPLTRSTEVLADWTTNEKAAALELLIREGVEHPSVGSEDSRERRVLRGAFRLPDPDINVAWAGTLAERWKQLKTLKQLFPTVSTTTTQPMEAAWTRGVRQLANYLERRLGELATPLDWQSYRLTGVEGVIAPRLSNRNPFRKHSDGAQPFVVNRMTVTVLIKNRNSTRRIVERLVTAQEDGVEFYLSRAFTAGFTLGRTYVPTVGLWGCQAELVPMSHEYDTVATRLRFPRPLSRNEQAYFASEALSENSEPSVDDKRNWVEVDVDHHGIEAGAFSFGGTFPLRARDEITPGLAVGQYGSCYGGRGGVPGASI